MAYSTTNLYPEDLNGTNPKNLISKESHTLQSPGPEDYYFIIPHAAPFFVDSVVVTNSAGVKYVEGTDYQVGHLFVEAMDSIGRPIAGSIRFMRESIAGQALVTYRTIGGNWGFDDAAILRELSNKTVNPLIRSWGDIAPLPYSFPPLPHDQSIDTLVGSKEVNASLNRIADILEATAAGTSQSHITNYNNPHRVTKAQVGLGNVPNFTMATTQQHLDANRNDLFTNPVGVLALVNKYAVDPLNTHIRAKGNVHDMTPSDIGLGNVPNWKVATPAQAIDPTNTNTFLSPYLASLLVQKLQSDPRLDQLIIDFNNHITANNPHDITPTKIGAYTKEEVDALIDNVEQGGNAATFGGETPQQWVVKFPSNDDINTMLGETNDVYEYAITALNAVNVNNPISQQDIDLENSYKITNAWAEYNSYALYNPNGNMVIKTSPVIQSGIPTGVITTGGERWSSFDTAGYYIKDDGSITTTGTGAIVIPVGYATGTGYQTANACKAIYASKDYLYVYKVSGTLIIIPRTGSIANVVTDANFVTAFINSGMVDSRAFGIYNKLASGVSDFVAVGDSTWVTAYNSAKTAVTGTGKTLANVQLCDGYVLFHINTSTQGTVKVYRINYAASITLTDVTTSTNLIDIRTGTTVTASSITDVLKINAGYGNFFVGRKYSTNANEARFNLFAFGDNSQGQLDIASTQGPFIDVSAGYKLVITVNSQNFVGVWGDTVNNSLLYNANTSIKPN